MIPDPSGKPEVYSVPIRQVIQTGLILVTATDTNLLKADFSSGLLLNFENKHSLADRCGFSFGCEQVGYLSL